MLTFDWFQYGWSTTYCPSKGFPSFKVWADAQPSCHPTCISKAIPRPATAMYQDDREKLPQVSRVWYQWEQELWLVFIWNSWTLILLTWKQKHEHCCWTEIKVKHRIRYCISVVCISLYQTWNGPKTTTVTKEPVYSKPMKRDIWNFHRNRRIMWAF